MAWNPIQMKQENLSVLRNVFLKQHSATKPQLAKLSGLSVVTVNSLIHELLETGEVIQKQMLPSGGGRPALQYQYNARYKMALTAYMYVQEGRERLFLEVQDLFQNMVASDAYELADMNINLLEDAISRWMKQYPTISVMVFGIPGTEHQGKLKVMDYAILQSQELFAKLRSTYQVPVLIENDINAALFGYCQRQHIRQECTAGLYFPKKYPPGSALYIRGDIYRGANHMVGELDQLPLGVNWREQNISDEQQLHNMDLLIQSIACMYDPQALLIYCDAMDEALLKRLITIVKTEWKVLTPPTMILRSSIHEDFSLGVREIAARELFDQIIRKERGTSL